MQIHNTAASCGLRLKRRTKGADRHHAQIVLRGGGRNARGAGLSRQKRSNLRLILNIRARYREKDRGRI
jgi:hypothetical protein